MGTIQNQLNSALGAVARVKVGKKIIKISEDVGEFKEQTPSWIQQQEQEKEAIHKEQKERIEKEDARSGEKVYVPEDLSSDPSAMGPMPYMPAAFGADGFYMHNPSLAQAVNSNKIEQGGMNALKEAQRAIDIKNMRKQIFKQRWEDVTGGKR